MSKLRELSKSRRAKGTKGSAILDFLETHSTPPSQPHTTKKSKKQSTYTPPWEQDDEPEAKKPSTVDDEVFDTGIGLLIRAVLKKKPDNGFYQSIASQFIKKGLLSDAQRNCVEKAYRDLVDTTYVPAEFKPVKKLTLESTPKLFMVPKAALKPAHLAIWGEEVKWLTSFNNVIIGLGEEDTELLEDIIYTLDELTAAEINALLAVYVEDALISFIWDYNLPKKWYTSTKINKPRGGEWNVIDSFSLQKTGELLQYN